MQGQGGAGPGPIRKGAALLFPFFVSSGGGSWPQGQVDYMLRRAAHMLASLVNHSFSMLFSVYYSTLIYPLYHLLLYYYILLVQYSVYEDLDFGRQQKTNT